MFLELCLLRFSLSFVGCLGLLLLSNLESRFLIVRDRKSLGRN
jgi:hypothetical protein